MRVVLSNRKWKYVLYFIKKYILACLSSFSRELSKFFPPGKFNQTDRVMYPGLLLHPGSPCNNYKGTSFFNSKNLLF